MNKLGMWQVIDGKLKRVNESSLDLERSLEDWISEDPALIQAGLVIVGRQIDLEGGRLDLLAIDPQGRWTIIELKKGFLRRETIAQAIDYASCIATLSADELRSKIDPYLKKNNQSLDLPPKNRSSRYVRMRV